MVKKKAMAARAVSVPQNREEATAMLAQYGDLLRQIEHIEVDLNQALADAKKDAVERAAPLRDEAEQLFKGLQTFCDANRVALTNNGAAKTVDFGTGKVSWRWNPAKVSLRGKVEEIISRIKAAGDQYHDFLRVTFEVDKVAMLRDPNRAMRIEGVKVAPAGETFAIETFAEEKLPETV